MKVTNLETAEKTALTMEGARGVAKQVPLSARDGSPAFSFRVFTIEPGGHTPYHTHPFEHLNYVIEGEGALVKESGETAALHAGDFALVLPGEKHQYRNTGDKPLVFMCMVPSSYE